MSRITITCFVLVSIALGAEQRLTVKSEGSPISQFEYAQDIPSVSGVVPMNGLKIRITQNGRSVRLTIDGLLPRVPYNPLPFWGPPVDGRRHYTYLFEDSGWKVGDEVCTGEIGTLRKFERPPDSTYFGDYFVPLTGRCRVIHNKDLKATFPGLADVSVDIESTRFDLPVGFYLSADLKPYSFHISIKGAGVPEGYWEYMEKTFPRSLAPYLPAWGDYNPATPDRYADPANVFAVTGGRFIKDLAIPVVTPANTGKTQFYSDTPSKPSVAGITVLRREADFPFVRTPGDPNTNRWLLFALINNGNRVGVNDIKSLDRDLTYKIHGHGVKLADLIAQPEVHSPLMREGFNKMLDGLGLEAVVRLGDILGVLIVAEATPVSSGTVFGGLPPGFRKLTIDGAEGEWLLDPGTVIGEITILRTLFGPTKQTVPLEEAYIYDKVTLSVTTVQDVRDLTGKFVDNLEINVLRNGDVISFAGKETLTARRVPGSNVYQTDTFYLVPSSTPQTMRNGAYHIPFSSGDTLTVSANQRWFSAPLVNQVLVSNGPTDLTLAVRKPARITMGGLLRRPGEKIRPAWEFSLADASRLAGNKPAEAEAAAFFNLYIFQLSGGTTKFLVKDHAAMLLLRTQFLWMAEQQKKTLERLLESDTALLRYARHLSDVAISRPSFVPKVGPLSIEVVSFKKEPPGTDWTSVKRPLGDRKIFTLAEALVEYRREKGKNEFGREYFPEPQPDWLLRTTRYTVNQQIKWIDSAIAEAGAPDIRDIDALLQLTGDEFQPVIDALQGRLVILDEQRAADGSIEKVWKANEKARVAVNQVGAGFFQLSSARRAARADTDAFITLISFGTVGVGKSLGYKLLGLAAGAVEFGYSASDLFKARLEEDQIRFAANSIAVIGPDRFNRAKARQQPAWRPFGKLFLSAVGLGFDIADFSPGIPLSTAYEISPTVAATINSRGIPAIPEIPPAEMRALVVAVNDARLAETLGKRLTPVQEQLLQAARRIEHDALPGTRTQGVRVPPAPDVNVPSGPAGSVKVSTVKGLERAPIASQTLYHDTGKAVLRRSGDVIEIGDLIARGEYAWVYRLLKDGKATGKVVKVVRRPDWEKDSFDEIFRRMEETDKLYKQFAENNPGTPYLDAEFVKWRNDMGIIIQDDVEAIKGYVYKGSDFPDDVPPEAFLLALELYRKFAKDKIAWLDPHFKNLYFTRGLDGKLAAAGVLDPDLMIREGELATNAFMAARIIDREFGLNSKIRSADNRLPVSGKRAKDVVVDDRVKAVKEAIDRGTLPDKLDEGDIAMVLEEQADQTADVAIMEIGKGLKIRLQNAELIMLRHLEAYEYIRFERSVSEVVKTKGAVRGRFVDGTMKVSDVIKAFPNLNKYVTFGDHLLKTPRQGAVRPTKKKFYVQQWIGNSIMEVSEAMRFRGLRKHSFG